MNRNAQFNSNLLECLLANDLNKLITTIYEELQCPFNITDEYYHLLVQIPKKKINDLIWDSYVDHNSLSVDIVKLLNENNLIGKGYFSPTPYMITSPSLGKYPRVTVRLNHEEKIFGYLTVYYIDKEPSENDLSKIEIAGKVLAYYYNKNRTQLSTIQNIYELVLNNLFLELINTEEELMEYQSILPVPLKEKCIILCVQSENDSNITFLQKISNELKYHYHFDKCTIYKENLYLLFDEIQRTSTQKIFDQCIKLLCEYQLKIGISGVFSNLLNARIYRKQAEISASLCEKGKTLYFSDGALDAIALQLKANSNIFVHPAFETLKDYDFKNNTEYFKTLQCYVQHFAKHNEIEKVLQIHRNTVRNRLGAIENITQISLEDPYTFTHLYLSLILMQHCA